MLRSSGDIQQGICLFKDKKENTKTMCEYVQS